MHLATALTTIQTIRAGKVIAQRHQAVIQGAATIESPTLNLLQKAVEAAGGKFARKTIRVIKVRAED